MSAAYALLLSTAVSCSRMTDCKKILHATLPTKFQSLAVKAGFIVDFNMPVNTFVMKSELYSISLHVCFTIYSKVSV
jgi:hypothetical protein